MKLWPREISNFTAQARHYDYQNSITLVIKETMLQDLVG